MIIADTNVIARLFLKDDLGQVKEVSGFIQEAADEEELIYLSSVVLAELVWMLRSRMDKRDIIAALEFLTESPDFVVGHRQAVAQALAWYKAGKADFADYLIHADGVSVGAKEMVTFDAAFVAEDKRRKRPRAVRRKTRKRQR